MNNARLIAAEHRELAREISGNNGSNNSARCLISGGPALRIETRDARGDSHARDPRKSRINPASRRVSVFISGVRRDAPARPVARNKITAPPSPRLPLPASEGKKARPRCIVKLARIENNRAIRSGEEASGREQDEDEEEEEDEEKKEGAGEEGEEEEASTASARLTEAVSLRFIAALDHERRKTSQGRPVLRSSLPLRVPRSGPPSRPLALFFSLLLLLLNEHLLLGKTVCQPAAESAHLILHRAL